MWLAFWWPFWWLRQPPRIRSAHTDDAAALAGIHAESFAHAWDALTLESMLSDRSVCAHVMAGDAPEGFIIARCVADEAEVLTVAVAGAARGKGHGRLLLDASLAELVRRRIRKVFLEVEAGNSAALRLYAGAGFEKIGTRRGYYRQPDGSRRDAVTMALDMAGRAFAPVLDA